MKTKHLLLSFVGVAAISWSVFLNFIDVYKVNIDDKQYQVRTEKEIGSKAEYGSQGAAEWLHRLRANPATGTISKNDIAKARQSFEALKQNRSGNVGDMNWDFMGPDNVGGRTRAFLVDNRDNSTLWAGGVAGGLWKSTTNGLSWLPIAHEGFQTMAISSLCQDNEGNIYIGTGEYFAGGGTNKYYTSGVPGAGLWKYDNSSTLSNLNVPEFTGDINELEFNPVENKLFCASSNGLYSSTDQGTTWTLINNTQGTNIADVKVSNSGSVYYISDNGYLRFPRLFVSIDGVSYTEKTDMLDVGLDRIELAVAPSDENYVYALCSYIENNSLNTGKYFNMYQSKDKGETWNTVLSQHTSSVDVFRVRSQGTYDNIIRVFPDDPEHVFLGGIDLWTWTPGNSFEQVSYWQIEGSKKVHGDQHNIVFHPDYANNQTVYFATDGGIYVSNDGGVYFSDINKNYGVTQYYAIDCGPQGDVLGGCQDNGNPYIDMLQPADPKSSVDLPRGGDGGYSAISELYPNALFWTNQHTNLYRSNEGGVEATTQTNPFDIDGNKSTRANLRPDDDNNPFVTPIDMWESFNYDSSRIYLPFVVDTVVKFDKYSVPDTLSAFGEGFVFFVESSVVNNKHFEYQVTADDIANNNGDSIRVGDTLVVREKFASLMAIGGGAGTGKIYFTREALNFKTIKPNWEAVVGPLKNGESNNIQLGISHVYNLKWGPNGNDLYAIAEYNNGSSSGYGLFRFTGFKDSYSYTGTTYDKRILTQNFVMDIPSNKISNFQLLTSTPIDVWSITYNLGSNVTNKKVIDIDTIASSIVMNLNMSSYTECDTNQILNVYGDSIISNAYGAYNHEEYSLIAGTELFDSIFSIDTNYVDSYLINLISLDYENCLNDTIYDVNTDSINSADNELLDLDLDSVYMVSSTINNVVLYDTISISGADTILNIISKEVINSVCILDTVFNVNNDSILLINSYSYQIPYSNIYTESTVFNNIFNIDTLNHFIDTLISIQYRDLASGCQMLTVSDINIDTVSSFASENISNNYYSIALNNGLVYNNIVSIDTMPSQYIVNLTTQDTTFEMGVMSNDMVWNNRDVYTIENISGRMLKSFGYTYPTSVSVDPKDSKKIIVTVAGYGVENQVYYCEDVTAIVTPWKVVDGSGLPDAPAFSSLIVNTYDDNENCYIVGTEYGIYSTSELNESATQWVREESIPVVPVFSLIQQTQPNGYLGGVGETGVVNCGEIYAGTHGLGAWRMSKYKQPYTGIRPVLNEKLDALLVKVYPNPVRDIANVEYNVVKTSDVEIEIYSLSGQQVYRNTVAQQNKGTYVQRISTENFGKGVYVISVTSNNERKVSKFIVE